MSRWKKRRNAEGSWGNIEDFKLENPMKQKKSLATKSAEKKRA